jgi:hypothetical protein
MQSDGDRDERQTAPIPDHFERDPLKLAESLAEEYTQLSNTYEAPGGTRDQLNMHLQNSYWLGFFYYQNAENYRTFQNHEYFRGLHQMPHEGNIMRSVLKFTTRARGNKQRLYRLYKRAPVFEYLYDEGVIPDDIAALLKERGGIDCIYDQLCAEKKVLRETFPAEDESNDVDPAEAEVVAFEPKDSAAADEERQDETGEADGNGING